jgi:hypothetical protein
MVTGLEPVRVESPNFENFIFSNGSIGVCYWDATLGVPCQQGSVPIMLVLLVTIKQC